MSEPAQKCENNLFLSKTMRTLKWFIAFKMANSCCFSLGGNLDFPEFLPKKSFITLTEQDECLLLALHPDEVHQPHV